MTRGNYTKIQNHCLRDKRLSYGAKGLLAYMISRPPIWRFYVKRLSEYAANCSEHKTRIYLKELLDCGYLKMEKVLDDKTKKFSGSRYVLNREVIDNAPVTILSDLKNAECQVSRPSENANVGETELRQSVRHNKTETNMTEVLKKKDYQQQEKQVAAVAGDIDNFFLGLIQDEAWRSSFQNEMLGDRLITSLEFELVLFQFREHVLRKNECYPDSQGVKQHFLNWFNTQKDKGWLLGKLQKEKQKQAELIKKVDDLTSKVNQMVDMRNALSFPSKEKVLEAKLILESSVTSLTDLMKAIQDNKVKAIILTTLDNAHRLIDLIKRGSEKNGLGLLCTNAKPSN